MDPRMVLALRLMSAGERVDHHSHDHDCSHAWDHGCDHACSDAHPACIALHMDVLNHASGCCTFVLSTSGLETQETGVIVQTAEAMIASGSCIMSEHTW